MNLTLHLIGSDFRYLRLFLSVWWGLVILQAVLDRILPPALFQREAMAAISPTFLAMLVAILKLCLLTVIVSQAVQKDSTVGSTAFWLSRPISRGRLLASKALFLVLAVVLPTLLVEVVSLRVCGVTQDDTLRSIPQMVFLHAIGHPRLMMLAALTPNLPRLILSGIIVVVGLPLLWFILLFLSALAMGAVTDPSVGVELVPPIPPPSFSLILLGQSSGPSGDCRDCDWTSVSDATDDAQRNPPLLGSLPQLDDDRVLGLGLVDRGISTRQRNPGSDTGDGANRAEKSGV